MGSLHVSEEKEGGVVGGEGRLEGGGNWRERREKEDTVEN